MRRWVFGVLLAADLTQSAFPASVASQWQLRGGQPDSSVEVIGSLPTDADASSTSGRDSSQCATQSVSRDTDCAERVRPRADSNKPGFASAAEARTALRAILDRDGVKSYLRSRRADLGISCSQDADVGQARESCPSSRSSSPSAVPAERNPQQQPCSDPSREEGPVPLPEPNVDGEAGDGTDDEGLRARERARRAAATVQMWHACKNGDAKALAVALGDGADPHACDDEDRMSAMHYAAASGSGACIRLLLKAGASIRCRDERGLVPLHLAAMRGFDSVCELLLSSGARLLDATNVGANAIDLAEQNGHVALTKTLSELVQVELTRRRYIGSKGHTVTPHRRRSGVPGSDDQEEELRRTLAFLERDELVTQERRKRDRRNSHASSGQGYT